MAYTPKTWECGENITSERLNKLEEGVADIMSGYVPTEWQCGDVITAERLNKLEQAVAEASEGGGGSSDFSTAQVTFINADMNTQAYSAKVSVIKDNGIEAVSEQVLTPVTVTVPLYKGVNILPISCVTNNNQSYMPTADGSIVFDIGRGGFVVTGDGSITAKGIAIN